MAATSQPIVHKPVVTKGLLFLAAVFVCLGLGICWDLDIWADPEVQAVRATESALTTAHGAEARLAIQRFIDTYWSYAAFRNPQLLSQVMTGQELTQFQALRRGWTSKTLDINRSTVINQVHVIAYDPTQFKAFSCEILNLDTVTLEGIYVRSMKPRTGFRVYVFNRENGSWKVAAWTDFSDADHIDRDWEYTAQWQKDLIGDLPRLIDKYDSCFSP